MIPPLPREMPDQDKATTRAEERLARRRFLRRSVLVISGLSTTAVTAAGIRMVYPNLHAQFGEVIDAGDTENFPAAIPEQFRLNQMGIYYQATAQAYIVHLAQETRYLLTGSALATQMAAEQFVRASDGSCWLALSQFCPARDGAMTFLNACSSFLCSAHGAHFLCDGEYADGPAPRSMDRFSLSIQHGHILLDTSATIMVPRPSDTQRILPLPGTHCPIY